jgi:hypothetical protein
MVLGTIVPSRLSSAYRVYLRSRLKPASPLNTARLDSAILANLGQLEVIDFSEPNGRTDSRRSVHFAVTIFPQMQKNLIGFSYKRRKGSATV